MKLSHGWYLPDHETHLVEWMSHPRNASQVADGRVMYQAVKQRRALEFCKSFRTAVDIGAHCGLWSFYFAKQFDRVDAFEPVAEHRECFCVNVDGVHLNIGCDSILPVACVTLHACALGAKEGSIRISTTRASSGNSYIDGDGDVPLRTLDSFSLNDVDFVKADCEGYELHAMVGAKETIERCKPVIIVEQKPGRAQRFGLAETGAVAYLESLGYRMAQEMSGDYIMVPT